MRRAYVVAVCRAEELRVLAAERGGEAASPEGVDFVMVDPPQLRRMVVDVEPVPPELDLAKTDRFLFVCTARPSTMSGVVSVYRFGCSGSQGSGDFTLSVQVSVPPRPAVVMTSCALRRTVAPPASLSEYDSATLSRGAPPAIVQERFMNASRYSGSNLVTYVRPVMRVRGSANSATFLSSPPTGCAAYCDVHASESEIVPHITSASIRFRPGLAPAVISNANGTKLPS